MQAITDVTDLVQLVIGGANGVLANSVTLGLWYLTDALLTRVMGMLVGILPNEILNMSGPHINLFLKLFIFHHIALK